MMSADWALRAATADRAVAKVFLKDGLCVGGLRLDQESGAGNKEHD
jgi:hypothetical protein